MLGQLLAAVELVQGCKEKRESGIRGHGWKRRKNEDRTCMKRKVAEELCVLGQ